MENQEKKEFYPLELAGADPARPAYIPCDFEPEPGKAYAFNDLWAWKHNPKMPLYTTYEALEANGFTKQLFRLYGRRWGWFVMVPVEGDYAVNGVGLDVTHFHFVP